MGIGYVRGTRLLKIGDRLINFTDLLRPLDDTSLGQRVPWTTRPLDERRVTWTMCPLTIHPLLGRGADIMWERFSRIGFRRVFRLDSGDMRGQSKKRFISISMGQRLGRYRREGEDLPLPSTNLSQHLPLLYVGYLLLLFLFHLIFGDIQIHNENSIGITFTTYSFF
jgi:hypothetical protein